MCERTLTCPRCDTPLNDTNEMQCSTSTMGTLIAWACPGCDSTVRLSSTPAVGSRCDEDPNSPAYAYDDLDALQASGGNRG